LTKLKLKNLSGTMLPPGN